MYEIVGILLVSAGVFIFLSLLSYSPIDPSFFSYTSPRVKEVHNWMGIVGSYVSSLLFQGFGFPSFLISFLLIVFAFCFIFRWELKYLSVKVAGWVLILLTTSSLFGLWAKPIGFYNRDLLFGGFLGEICSRNLIRYFNLPGATILLLMILILSFVLGTGISFISVIRRLGGGVRQWVERSVRSRWLRRNVPRGQRSW